MHVAPKTVEVQIGAALRMLRAELRDSTGWSPSSGAPRPFAENSIERT